MKAYLFGLAMAAVFASGCTATADEGIWPEGKTAAIALTYDDTLDSQLDFAIPALDEAGLKGSFYIVTGFAPYFARYDEWVAAAQNGHELGNHTLMHPCSSSLPGRDWVSPLTDLDGYTVERAANEIRIASGMLALADGMDVRTFGPPCGDVMASDGNYVDAVRGDFLAVRGEETMIPGLMVVYSAPDGATGDQLIADAERMIASGGLGIYVFHGTGGDHLAVSAEAHKALVEWLAARDDVWVAPYRDIMLRVREQQD